MAWFLSVGTSFGTKTAAGMKKKEFSALCARVNAALDVKQVVALIGYYPERAIQVAGLWRLFCPIHQETVFRTLVINPRRNTYHCEHTLCAAHQPGDLIDLLAKVHNKTRSQVVVDLMETVGQDVLRLSEDQEKLLREYALAGEKPE